MASASVDSIVTDPPYGLSKEPDIIEVLRHWMAGDDYTHSDSGFMGNAWDSFVPGPSIWREALRVLKPGGHILCFAGTRTLDLMGISLRMAGFEIRDCIRYEQGREAWPGWMYGQGFPKSLDIAKAMDKRRDEDKEPIRVVCRAVRAAMDAVGLKSRQLTTHFNDCNARLIDHWAARDSDSQPALPTPAQWLVLRRVLTALGPELDAEVARLNQRKGSPGDTWQNADIVGAYEGDTGGFGEHRFSVRDKLIREHSDAAKRWKGWGTALKPAWEPVIVGRKPTQGTATQNVLQHGCGALNIDGCRVGTDSTRRPLGKPLNGGAYGSDRVERASLDAVGGSDNGRWPANVIHDGSDAVEAAFAYFGERSSGSRNGIRKAHAEFGTFAENGRDSGYLRQGDTGSASRFFYCAKASKAERDGSRHPTVKPVALMAYLCRLVTPPGGTVLDPFAGSGTTGQAAVQEGFHAVLVEREAEYCADIRHRLALFMDDPAADAGSG